MVSRDIRVWLPEPDSVALMGGLPDGMAADVWTGGEQVPDSADEVEVVVLPFGVPPPRFAAAQRAGTWSPAGGELLAGQTVLIVGFGSIGEAVERLLAPFGVTMARIARRARPGVSSLEELPAVLPKADIVIVLLPVTPATTGLVDARFLGQRHDGALLVNAARGSIVDTAALVAELQAGRLRAAPGQPGRRAGVRGDPGGPGRDRGHHRARRRRVQDRPGAARARADRHGR